MFCQNCGSSLEVTALTCPRCGKPVPAPAPASSYQNPYQAPPQGYSPPPPAQPSWQQQPYPQQPAQQPSGWNLFAVLGFVLTFLPFPAASFVCCVIGLIQCKQTGQRGRGLAIAGIVVRVALVVLSIVAIIGFVWLAAEYGDEFYYGDYDWNYGFASLAMMG